MLRHYEVTVKVLIAAPPDHTRATEKMVHGLVQEMLPGMQAVAADGDLRIIGASAIGSVDVGQSDDDE